MISAIVVTGPPRLFPEQCVLRHCFRSQDTMLKFPCALQLMQAVGANVLKILSKHLEKFESPIEQRLARYVEHAVAAHIFVHDLLKPLQAMQRRDVAWGNG